MLDQQKDCDRCRSLLEELKNNKQEINMLKDQIKEIQNCKNCEKMFNLYKE